MVEPLWKTVWMFLKKLKIELLYDWFFTNWAMREDQPVYPKRDQSWVFIERTDVEAETLIIWPPDVKSWLIGKDAEAGKDWGQEEKGTTKDKKAGWHHWLNGHEFGYTPGVGDGQGGLMCCGSWGYKESDTTEWLNSNELIWLISLLAIELNQSLPMCSPALFLLASATLVSDCSKFSSVWFQYSSSSQGKHLPHVGC